MAILVQNDRFGTSIGDSLRNHSDFLRTRRRQEAEERAGKVGVKLVFPIFLLHPAVDAGGLGGTGFVADFQVPLPDDASGWEIGEDWSRRRLRAFAGNRRGGDASRDRTQPPGRAANKQAR